MPPQRFQALLLCLVSAACVSFSSPREREYIGPVDGDLALAQHAAESPPVSGSPAGAGLLDVAAAPPLGAPAAARPQPGTRSPLVEAVAEHLLERGTVLSPAEVGRVAQAIVSEATARDLDPFLVLAVIHVESRFDAFAVSPAGAMGLMQIRPSTGKALAAKIGMAWHGARTLLDPAANVRLGIAYLASMRRRFRSLEIALAAYNWGPGEIRRRVESGVDVPESYSRRVLSVYSETADLPIRAS